MLGCNGNGCSEEQTSNNQDQCRAGIFEDTETAGLGDLEPDFGDFLAEHAVASPGGGWIVEGDMHFTSTQHLYEHFRYNQPRQSSNNGSEIRRRSTVGCFEDFDRIWNVDMRLRITYCMGSFTDQPLQEMVEAAFPEAIAQMERAADVNYIKVPFASAQECEDAWGDFDGDGCEDVLWFAPHTDVSPLSRARCTAPPTPSEGFDDQPAQDHPQTSYPVGYARTRARR